MADKPEDKPKRVLVKAPKTAFLEPLVVPTSPSWSRNQHLLCPIGGGIVFADMPALSFRGQPVFPLGPIYLRYGEHFSANSGFGFQHIWREHFFHIKNHDDAMLEVRTHVAGILRPGTQVYYEHQRSQRPVLQRLRVGRVVLELRGAETYPHYSVVTAGFDPANTKGSLVGALV